MNNLAVLIGKIFLVLGTACLVFVPFFGAILLAFIIPSFLLGAGLVDAYTNSK